MVPQGLFTGKILHPNRNAINKNLSIRWQKYFNVPQNMMHPRNVQPIHTTKQLAEGTAHAHLLAYDVRHCAVPMALRKCVDCGNGLGYSVTVCPKCGSKDPLGSQRATQKFVAGLVVVLVAVFAVGWYGFDLNPLQLVSKFMHLTK